jgi:hypothetical protein
MRSVVWGWLAGLGHESGFFLILRQTRSKWDKPLRIVTYLVEIFYSEVVASLSGFVQTLVLSGIASPTTSHRKTDATSDKTGIDAD